ncbi:type IV secretory system conjugative DNA transfer family protein [Catenulispora pinisilvae]|uniref:type IV secretory system conjugative DNA transfer family protein n=1 Tax=Catenulispora pinisilvae TaxID=2705253 RepID=UPI001890CDFC|nr:type IV secretory system conjugative DNA transfer family protein [Catenulispora pinisilvae]
MHGDASAPQVPVIQFLNSPQSFLSSAGRVIGSFLETWWQVATPAALALTGTAAGARLVLHARHRRFMSTGARLVEVQLPPEVGADAASKFWSHVHAMLRPTWRRFFDGQPHLSFEYCFSDTNTRIEIWVPGVVPPRLVEAAVESAWPGAHTTVLKPAPSPIPSTTVAPATGGRLRLAKTEVLPLNTKHDSDPLRPLFGVGAGLRPDEHIAVQVLARPATGRRLRIARRKVHRLRSHAMGLRRTSRPTMVLSMLDELTPGVKNVALPLGARTDPMVAAEVRAAVSKATGSLWEAEIRYVVAAVGSIGSQLPDDRLRGVAGAVAATFGVFAERNWWARRRLRHPIEKLTSRHFDRGDLLNIAELASVAHLPTDAFALGVERAGARSVAPAPTVATAGRSVKPLGETDAGPARIVGPKVADSRQHLHIIGSTGSGKSTLMGGLILDDVTAGRGVVVVDPKGDLVPDLLERLPESAGRRTILIDPTAPDPHPTLNVLASAAGDDDLLVDNLVGIFRRIFSAHWGPRTDDVLRAALLTLQATSSSKVLARVKDPTLMDVPELLTNDAVRRRTLSRLSGDDNVLRGFWRGYDALSEAGRSAVVAPLLNKLRAFLLRDFVRSTVGDPASTIDLSEVLNGGILLVRIPKGVLGEETARLLGSFVVAATWHAASARTKSAEGARIDAALYLDEAHNFLSMPISMEDMLAEARGYRLSLTLAHQNLAQMPTDLREGISSNARNKVFFACSPEDAKALAVHTSPMLTEHDLAHLGGYQAAVRLNVDGVQAPAFTLRTLPLPSAIPGRADRIRQLSREATSARRREIEQAEPSPRNQGLA